MRVVVIKEYIDRYTSERHEIGEKLDVTEERFAEMEKVGKYVVDISDEVGQQETPAVSDENADQEQSEPAEPQAEQQEEQPKTEKAPANGGRRNRKKAESEDK